MSNLFVYIDIVQQPGFLFSKPEMDEIKLIDNSITTIDIDNFSDQSLIENIVKAIEEAKKVVIFLKCEEGANTYKLLKVIDSIVKHKNKTCVLLQNGTENLTKMLNITGLEIHKDLPSKEVITTTINFTQQ